jgi:hypothetical protein
MIASRAFSNVGMQKGLGANTAANIVQVFGKIVAVSIGNRSRHPTAIGEIEKDIG